MNIVNILKKALEFRVSKALRMAIPTFIRKYK